jgi:hypothetical protein
MRHSSVPVSITPLVLSQLPMTRPRDPHQSTEFSFSRFLVPWLCGYEGMAVFMDCDMLCRADIAELCDETDFSAAVSVVHHHYKPVDELKFLEQKQTAYERKNWSSVMVFNNARCKALTPDYVNTATGLQLHQFKWIDDAEIGKLDPAWNHLVTEYAPNLNAKLVHFTRGTPCFRKFERCEYASEWREEQFKMTHHNAYGEFSIPDRMTA